MPLIDMPLDELLTYQGRNPRPADFDAYWEAGLAEMRGLDAAVEITPAVFQVPGAECFDLWFRGVRGARVYAKYVRPAGNPGPHPAVVMLHGYSGSSGDWFDKLSWVALGYSIVALDCRGQGGQSEDTGGAKGNTLRGHIIRGLDGAPEDLLFRHIYLDAAQLAGIALELPEVDPERVCAIGGSQGGGLTLACAALEPRIRKAFPIFPFLCDYLRVWEMDLAKDAYEELRTYLRMFDPLHARKDEVFERLGYIDCQFLAPRIRADVRMAVGLMDTVCPPSTQFAAYNKITSKKDLLIYPDFGHEGLPGVYDRACEFLTAW